MSIRLCVDRKSKKGWDSRNLVLIRVWPLSIASEDLHLMSSGKFLIDHTVWFDSRSVRLCTLIAFVFSGDWKSWRTDIVPFAFLNFHFQPPQFYSWRKPVGLVNWKGVGNRCTVVLQSCSQSWRLESSSRFTRVINSIGFDSIGRTSNGK